MKKDNGTLYWYGPGGEVLSETDLAGNNPVDYVYFGGRRLARVAGGTAYYYLEDHLGSARKLVQAGHNAACYDADFEPYGREHIITNSCPQHYKFASMEQDAETALNGGGNHHTPARQYPPNLGRWLSPDPGGVNMVHLDDPQTWNMYAYVRNSPTTLADPTGLEGQSDTSGKNGTPLDKGCQSQPSKCRRRSDDKPGPEKLPGQVTINVVGNDGKVHGLSLKVGSQVLVMTESQTEDFTGAQLRVSTYQVNNVTENGLSPAANTEVSMWEKTTAATSTCARGCTNKTDEDLYKVGSFIDTNSARLGGPFESTQHYYIGSEKKQPALVLRSIDPSYPGYYDAGKTVHVKGTFGAVSITLEP